MLSADMKDRLDLLIVSGNPIIIVGDVVAFPAEADELFSPEEIKILETYVRASMESGKGE